MSEKRTCKLCGSVIPDEVPLTAFNRPIDKCSKCAKNILDKYGFINEWSEQEYYKELQNTKTKVFSVRINKTDSTQEVNEKINKLKNKIDKYTKL